jgi:two-component sensor histidine kinase
MALIHEKLYQSADLAQIDFAAYLQSLVTFLAQSYRIESEKVEIRVDAQNIMLDIDTAIPCGLIVNELFSNSLKYAFPEDRAGSIEVSCHQPNKGQYVLEVFDDGVGLPAGFDMTRSPTLGLKLVTSLLEQLDGNLTVDNAHGVRYQINFTRN